MDLQLHLSPQLQVTIHTAAITQLNILQMSQQEIIEYIHKQLERNPFIEVEVQHERLLHEQAVMKNSFDHSKIEGPFPMVENRASTHSSLNDFIMDQLIVKTKQFQEEWPILLYLVEQLDDRLFLQIDASLVATKFQVEVARVTELIQVLQKLEPFGIAMENSKQFLMEQVKMDNEAPPLTSHLIENHLEELAKKKYRTLAKQYDCSVQTIEEIVDYIQTLSLYPIIQDNSGVAPPIIPDAIVEKLGNEWLIEIEQNVIPKVMLNDYYHKLLKKQEVYNKELKTSLQEAALLIQGLEARKQTLYRVVEKIVTYQQPFLEKGLDFIQPLTLVEVAQMTGLHESTISRAIRGKYIRTPSGILPIRALFKKGMKQSEGVATTVHTIQKKIEQLILNESAHKPLSDNQLVAMLQNEGVTISRRTVTKYREALGIPNSYERIRSKQ